MKNVLIYLGHPAQYHFFKYSIKNMENDGVRVKVLIKTKDVLEKLLIEDGIDYVNIQPLMRKNNSVSILIAMLKRSKFIYNIAKQNHSELLVGEDVALVIAGKLLNIPVITTLEDDYEVVRKEAVLSYPLTSTILVPNVCSVGRWTQKKIGYEGYMKLAYLHPNYFSFSNDVLKKYNIKNKYCLLRLAKLSAFHDSGIHGLNLALVKNLIKIIENKGYDIYISSEAVIDQELTPYQLRIDHIDIHHIMSGASLLISDSQSMSVEAAMLGVPSIRFSDFSGKIRVLEQLETEYQLTVGIKTNETEKLLNLTNYFLSIDNCKSVFQKRRLKMLADKIDVTSFLTWFIENYPKSLEQAKGQKPDSEFWKQFK